MKEPSKMTNKELAEHLEGLSYSPIVAEATNRLCAILEAAMPEFCVGWKGLNEDGDACEILDGDDNSWVGSVIVGGFLMCSMWGKDGTMLTSIPNSKNLVKNTTGFEIYYRKIGHKVLFKNINKIKAKNKDIEKVKIKVIK